MSAVGNSEFVLVYSTFPDRAAAEKMGRALVEARLAACVNIHSSMTSIYEWEGRLETASEFPVFVKTRRGLAARAIEAARALHPYTVPCFLVLPITEGSDDYLAWVRAQTAET